MNSEACLFYRIEGSIYTRTPCIKVEAAICSVLYWRKGINGSRFLQRSPGVVIYYCVPFLILTQYMHRHGNASHAELLSCLHSFLWLLVSGFWDSDKPTPSTFQFKLKPLHEWTGTQLIMMSNCTYIAPVVDWQQCGWSQKILCTLDLEYTTNSDSRWNSHLVINSL